MSDLVWPSDLPVASCSWDTDDFTVVDESPVNGSVQTSEIFGTRRQRVHFELKNLSRRTGTLQSFRALCARLQGRRNRIWLWDPTYVPLGTFAAPELLANNEFTSGASGWTSEGTLSSVDGALRYTRLTGNGNSIAAARNISVTQYLPYAVRSVVRAGRGAFDNVGPEDFGGGLANTGPAGGRAVGFVPMSTGSRSVGILDTGPLGGLPGDFLSVDWISASRCALADPGMNWFKYSNDLTQADWSKSATTVTANYYTAPDGNLAGSRLVETAANAEHYAGQTIVRTNAVGDWCFAVAVRAGTGRDRLQLRILDSGTSNVISAQFDLTNGVVSVAASATGSATNARAVIVSMVNASSAWYCCMILGRMPASDTTIRGIINIIQNPSTNSYTGNTANDIGIWRATLAPSAVPVRLAPTGSSSTPSGTAQAAAGLHLRGLDVSTSGLARRGDQIQVGRGLRIVTDHLETDSAGRGYLSLSEPVSGLGINEPVIFNRPMGRFILAQSQIGVEMEPGVFGGSSLDFVEAP